MKADELIQSGMTIVNMEVFSLVFLVAIGAMVPHTDGSYFNTGIASKLLIQCLHLKSKTLYTKINALGITKQHMVSIKVWALTFGTEVVGRVQRHMDQNCIKRYMHD